MINDSRKKVFGVGITDIYTGGTKKDKSYWKRENHYLSSFSDSDSTAKKFNEKTWI